jgi:hypothetical protein
MTPPCTHCGEEFDRHEARGDERWCRDGQRRFNVDFQPDPALIDFLREHPDASTTDLAAMWISRAKRKP